MLRASSRRRSFSFSEEEAAALPSHQQQQQRLQQKQRYSPSRLSSSNTSSSQMTSNRNNKMQPPVSSPARLEIGTTSSWDDDSNNNSTSPKVRGSSTIKSAMNFIQTKRGLTLILSTLFVFLLLLFTSSLKREEYSGVSNAGSLKLHQQQSNNEETVPPIKGTAYLTPAEFRDIRTANPGESVLVTGGLGFIGSHVVDLLLHRGFHVTILDDESNGHNHNAHVDLEMVPNDITVVGDFPKFPTTVTNVGSEWEVGGEEKYFTHVVHLAAAISVAESMKDPDKYERVNYGGSRQVLDWIAQYNQHISSSLIGGGDAHAENDTTQQQQQQQQSQQKNTAPFIRKVVAASSAAIYGDPDPSLLPLQESAPYGGKSPYADTKYRMETLMRDFVTRQNDHNTNQSSKVVPTASATALRFFNVYGPRQDPKNPYSGVISLFLDAAAKEGDITILGDGEMTRDFVYVKDVARAIVMALLQEKENGEGGTTTDHAEFSVYNVCTGVTITINTLATQVKKSMESSSAILHLDPRDGDIRDSSCNPNGAKEGMGFASAVPQEGGLEKTANWFRLEMESR